MKAKTIQQIEETIKCPKCNSKDIEKDQYRAELVCKECGLVIDEDLIDYSPEWWAFDHEQREKKARTGSPMSPLIHDKGLSTVIGWRNKDYNGGNIPYRNRAQIYRMRKWQRRIRVNDAVERNLAQALLSLDRMSSAMSLPRTIRENAAMIYRKAVLKNLIRGRSIEGVVAAALYAACRKYNVPRTLSEIHNKTNIPTKIIGRNYRHLAKELKLKLLPTSPQDYLPRFFNKLKLSREAQQKTKEIIDMALKKELTSGKTPTGIAAASVYIATVLCGEKKTQKQIAEIAGVTEVTVRNHYKVLAEELNINIVL
jgi:transcription initiation factor TFIIB